MYSVFSLLLFHLFWFFISLFKVTGCLYVCLSVPQDLTKCLIDMVSYTVKVPIGSWKVQSYFEQACLPPPSL